MEYEVGRPQKLSCCRLHTAIRSTHPLKAGAEGAYRQRVVCGLAWMASKNRACWWGEDQALSPCR